MKNLLAALILVSFLVNSCINQKFQLEFKFSDLETKTDASLRGLFVVDKNVIWASGSGGNVLVSKDGGENWNVIQVRGAEENDFRSIHAWDEKRAMVFGVAGPDFGYQTNDGGETWNVVFSDTTKGLFFNSLKFADTKNGLAVSDPIDGRFFVIRTENGGEKWETVTNIPNVKNGEANFAASNTCIEFLPSGKAWIASGGLSARVFYSDDFGESWEVSKTPMVRGQASSGIFSISFKNDLEGVIVGGTYDEPELNQNIASFTIDGGKTWHPSRIMPKEYRSCVQFISNNKKKLFFAIGKTGCDYSVDGGQNWNFISEQGYYTFVPIPGKPEGFVAGSKGQIAKVSVN